MAGFLLARQGVEVLVLEKHADFFRDFRGDTVHPSTLRIMKELGILGEFLKRPHQKATQVTAYFGDESVVMADFTSLAPDYGFLAFMPQWEFLDFLAQEGRKCPNFRLGMQANVTGLLEEADRVVGVRGKTPDGDFEVQADLVIAADGRHSVLRDAAALKVKHLGAPMDVLWMKLPKLPTDPAQPRGRIQPGNLFVMLDREAYWQCALVIPKGGYDRIRAEGLSALRARIARVEPMVAARLGAIQGWDDVKLLTVAVDRLSAWAREGLLCIGDAAHAMSPIGGVGINLAVQDAVAAARMLGPSLKFGAVTLRDLQAVQKRRRLPTLVTQWGQIRIQKRFLAKVLEARQAVSVPIVARLLRRFPLLRRIPARVIGIGVRAEHVGTALATSSTATSRPGASSAPP